MDQLGGPQPLNDAQAEKAGLLTLRLAAALQAAGFLYVAYGGTVPWAPGVASDAQVLVVVATRRSTTALQPAALLQPLSVPDMLHQPHIRFPMQHQAHVGRAVVVTPPAFDPRAGGGRPRQLVVLVHPHMAIYAYWEEWPSARRQMEQRAQSLQAFFERCLTRASESTQAMASMEGEWAEPQRWPDGRAVHIPQLADVAHTPMSPMRNLMVRRPTGLRLEPHPVTMQQMVGGAQAAAALHETWTVVHHLQRPYWELSPGPVVAIYNTLSPHPEGATLLVGLDAYVVVTGHPFVPPGSVVQTLHTQPYLVRHLLDNPALAVPLPALCSAMNPITARTPEHAAPSALLTMRPALLQPVDAQRPRCLLPVGERLALVTADALGPVIVEVMPAATHSQHPGLLAVDANYQDDPNAVSSFDTFNRFVRLRVVCAFGCTPDHRPQQKDKGAWQLWRAQHSHNGTSFIMVPHGDVGLAVLPRDQHGDDDEDSSGAPAATGPAAAAPAAGRLHPAKVKQVLVYPADVEFHPVMLYGKACYRPLLLGVDAQSRMLVAVLAPDRGRHERYSKHCPCWAVATPMVGLRAVTEPPPQYFYAVPHTSPAQRKLFPPPPQPRQDHRVFLHEVSLDQLGYNRRCLTLATFSYLVPGSTGELVCMASAWPTVREGQVHEPGLPQDVMVDLLKHLTTANLKRMAEALRGLPDAFGRRAREAYASEELAAFVESRLRAWVERSETALAAPHAAGIQQPNVPSQQRKRHMDSSARGSGQQHPAERPRQQLPPPPPAQPAPVAAKRPREDAGDSAAAVFIRVGTNAEWDLAEVLTCVGPHIATMVVNHAARMAKFVDYKLPSAFMHPDFRAAPGLIRSIAALRAHPALVRPSSDLHRGAAAAMFAAATSEAGAGTSSGAAAPPPMTKVVLFVGDSLNDGGPPKGLDEQCFRSGGELHSVRSFLQAIWAQDFAQQHCARLSMMNAHELDHALEVLQQRPHELPS